MSNKTWKDHLLSSGIPLEHSVVEVLNALAIPGRAEYKYERPNELGVPTVFSVDVHATHRCYKTNVLLEAFVECKYRHDGTNWVFTPGEHNRAFGPDLRDAFIVFDHFQDSHCVDVDRIGQLSSKYPLCTKGIELLPKDANPKTIEHALEQLRFALIDRAIAILSSEAAALGPITILVPLIVTTADLWRLRPEMSIEAIRRAPELSDVADNHKVLLIHQPPDNQMGQHTRSALRNSLSDPQLAQLQETFSSASQSASSIDFIDNFASSSPSVFVAIHYNYFEDAMTNLKTFFDNPSILRGRDNHF